jgi:hypothetical protein
VAQEQLDRLSEATKAKYSRVFDPIPHVNEMLTDVHCRIKLKDVSKTITTHTYTSLGEWAIASHGMYESTLVFISILK